ncbi:MAG TPA: tagatose 1,6-diphosphate aldolase [Anaerolineae bacterium]|nr:tagatose 1,6-diphosphate aldolase [Anaerolineae bacterium]HOQ97535.1 tagatose 1,6-diphosphate aldolase [Anaerolineae bacterium]HPL27520.1 tagatose 1,6-diphosphate aldolase [Anaerolineae bacterium]
MGELTIGKLRGLQQLANDRGVFAMVALDHRGSLQAALNPQAPGQVPYEALVDLKVLLVRALAPHASALLLDPVYGAAQAIGQGALPGDVGLIVSLEASGYEGDGPERRTALLPGWDVAKVKRMGAAAAKLLLYYHPAAATAPVQEELTRHVAHACSAHDIPFLLEPMSYALDPAAPKGSAAFARRRPAIVHDSALRLVPLGVDVLKAEFPSDLEYETPEQALDHCRRLTGAINVPWVLLSAAADYDLFRRQVEIACRGGASGFLAGRAIWQEITRLRRQEWDEFAATVAVARLQELVAIADAQARPYRPVLPVRQGWFEAYGAEPVFAALAD